MRFYFYLSIFFSSSFFYSQTLEYGNYYRLISKADFYLFDRPDYLRAAKILDSTLIYDGLPDNNLNAAIVNYNLKRYDYAYRHILKYAKSGYPLISIVNVLADSSIFKFRVGDLAFMLKRYPKLSKEYSSIQGIVKREFNVDFNNDLLKLFYKDQAVREVMDVFGNKIDSCCKDTADHFFDNEFIKTDSLVFIGMKALIKKYGMPQRQNISKEAFLAFYFVLVHNYTNEIGHLYCDSLLVVTRSRFKTDVFITPHEYAMIIDRYYLNIFGKNYYNEFYIPGFPIFEPDKINYRRKEIFLLEKEISE